MQRNGDDSKERFFPEAGMSPSTHSHDASTISYRIIFSSKKTEIIFYSVIENYTSRI